MDRAQFLASLGRLGISQAQFARALGINPQTVRRWQSPPSYAVAYLKLAESAIQTSSIITGR